MTGAGPPFAEEVTHAFRSFGGRMIAVLSPTAIATLRHIYSARLRDAVLDTIEDLSTRESDQVMKWPGFSDIRTQYLAVVPSISISPKVDFNPETDKSTGMEPLAVLFQRLKGPDARRYAHLGKPKYHVIEIVTLPWIIRPLLEEDADRAAVAPVYVYIDKGHPDELVQSVQTLAATFGFGLEAEGPPQLGSWTGRFRLLWHRIRSSRELIELLEKAERALEIAAHDLPQSGVTANEGKALSDVITALDKTDNALMQFGSMILLKRVTSDGRSEIVAHRLTVEDLRYLDRNPSLLQQPSTFLEHLAALREPPPAPAPED